MIIKATKAFFCGNISIRFSNGSALNFHMSNTKVFYPFLLSPNFQYLQYSPYYHHKTMDLKVGVKNKYQLNDTTLLSFLEKQIRQDKTQFLKQRQFLFIGRSNVGKSSIINKIFNDSTVARVAKAPGKTQFLHFHQIYNSNCYVVDAPGYGFANMNKKRRHLWYGLVEQYMKISSRLSQIFHLIHFQHGLKQMDKQFLMRADKFNVNIQLVFTKVDKVRQQKYFDRFRAIDNQIRRMQLKNVNEKVLAVSAKDNFGINLLRCRIIEAIQNSRPRNIDTKEDLLLQYLKQNRIAPTDIKQKQHQLSKEHIVRKLIYNSRLTKYLAK